MSRQSELKELVFETLIKQLRDGVEVTTKDGDVVTVDAGAPVIAVAAKVIKDWAGEGEKDAKLAEQNEKLSQFLARRRPDVVQGDKPN